jgi:hypothetical protein
MTKDGVVKWQVGSSLRALWEGFSRIIAVAALCVLSLFAWCQHATYKGQRADLERLVRNHETEHQDSQRYLHQRLDQFGVTLGTEVRAVTNLKEVVDRIDRSTTDLVSSLGDHPSEDATAEDRVPVQRQTKKRHQMYIGSEWLRYCAEKRQGGVDPPACEGVPVTSAASSTRKCP